MESEVLWRRLPREVFRKLPELAGWLEEAVLGMIQAFSGEEWPEALAWVVVAAGPVYVLRLVWRRSLWVQESS